MASPTQSEWPEADIPVILRSYGIEPCEESYQTIVGDGPLFLVRGNACVQYRTQNLGSPTIGNATIDFKALIVDENGKNRGVGIYYEVTKGGRGRGLLNCGKCWNDPQDGTGIVEFLSKLKKPEI